jgi:hypothetical protein
VHTILPATDEPAQHEPMLAFAASRDRFERMLGRLEGPEAGQSTHGEEWLEAASVVNLRPGCVDKRAVEFDALHPSGEVSTGGGGGGVQAPKRSQAA